MDPQSKKRKYEKLHCQHCHQEVSKSTWYAHYQNFFDSATGKWKEESPKQLGRPEFNFEEDGSESSDERGTESDGDFSFTDDQDGAICNLRDCDL